MFSNFYSENLAFYEIMRNNVVEPGRPQMTMAHSHFMLGTQGHNSLSLSLTLTLTHTHKEYALLIALLLRHKSEGRGFDSLWCHWNFSLT
jgi:hypothetical protein